METLKAKWQEMGLYRRILLAVMLAEIVGFLIAYVIVVNRPGLEYSGALLYPHTEGELQIYEGKIDGEPARFAVSPEGEISYQWGEYTYGPWQVVADPTALPERLQPHDGEWRFGLEITRDGEVLFRGGYLTVRPSRLYGADGEPVDDGISFYTTTTENGEIVISRDGQVISPAEFHQPTLATLARVVLNPALTHRGNIGYYLLATLLAVFNIFQICFPHFFFRLGLQLHVRNVDAVEPSDFYIAMDHLQWVFFAGICLLCYWMAVTAL